MSPHHKIMRAIGLQTVAMLRDANPQARFSDIEKIQITDYVWLNAASKLYVMSCAGYGLHSLLWRGSVLGLVLALIGCLFFWGFRGSQPSCINREVTK